MKKIYLHGKIGKGKFVIVDDDDYKYLSQFKWELSSSGYAVYRPPFVHMHRVVMKMKDSKKFVDHINGNKIDNRKSNLRQATKSQNAAGKKLNLKFKSSTYRGVSYSKGRSRWEAKIRVMGKTVHLGRFDRQQSAALAYNKAAKKYFGEFAYLNKL